MEKSSTYGRAERVLRAALNRRGWGYREGARFVDVPERSFAAWVKGEREPRDLTIGQQRRICELVGWKLLPEELWPARAGHSGSKKVRRTLLAARPFMLADLGLVWRPEEPEAVIEREEREHCREARLRPQEAMIIQHLNAGQSYRDLEIALAVTTAGLSYRLRRASRRLRLRAKRCQALPAAC